MARGRYIESQFKAAKGLAHPHLQTTLPILTRWKPSVPAEWEVFDLPDGDFVELAWSGPEEGPIAVVLHGLAGSWRAGVILGLAKSLGAAGWRVCRFNFRGCGRRPNRKPTGYHSGMTEDPLLVFQALRARYPKRAIVGVGISLGGNVLLRLLGEQQDQAPLDAAVAISAPMKLGVCSEQMDVGLSRVYQTYLLRRLRPLLRARRAILAPHVDVEGALRATTFRAFDDLLTAPLHGYADADDYYARASSFPILPAICRPTLILHSVDDPFMRPEVIPTLDEISDTTELEVTTHGGHVGFLRHGRERFWLNIRVPEWLEAYRSDAHLRQ